MFRVILSLLLCLSVSAKAESLSDRRVELIGAVDGSSLVIAEQIEKMSRESKDSIDFLINSPGGAVGPGMAVVDSMIMAKERGVRFRCFVGVLAASMAFIILTECDERYALPNAKLLFHPISLSTPGSRVQELILDLDQTKKQEERIMHKLRQSMGLSWRDFHRNYFAETFWSAIELAEYTDDFLTVVTRIELAGDNLFKYRKGGFNLFNNTQSNTVVNEIIRRYEQTN